MSCDKYILVAFFYICQFNLSGQRLISADLATSISKEIIGFNLGSPVENDIDAYKILYTTTDLEGRLDTASGLLVIPTGVEGPLPQVIYQHGTVNSRFDVPSELRGGWELALGISSFGFITIAPDFQGLGTSRGIHAYVHSESEALAAIDMLIAVQSFFSEIAVEVDDHLFITGYSQGGHAAMAAHRALERDYADAFTVTASSPMSGPYDISGAMIDFTLGDTEYSFVGYLAWTTLSYQRAYPNEISELSSIFREQYIQPIQEFANEEIDLGELNQKLRNLILEESDIVLPKLMYTEELLNIIQTKADHPINDAFKENDLHNWLALAPIRMMYCGMDEQVAFQNALNAEETMNQLGATDVEAVLIDENGTHGSCVVPASLKTIEFFKSFLDETSPTREEKYLSNQISLAPNPAFDELSLDYPETFVPNRVRILNSLGQTVLIINEKNAKRLSVRSLSSGLYFLRLENDKQHIVSRLLVE